jgi:hypothetical protein
MSGNSTREAAKKIGIGFSTLSKYIAQGVIPLPPVTRVGGVRVRLWADEDIHRVRKLLPKLKNGRKTRYQKKHSAVSTQQSTKPKTRKQPRAERPVSHKQSKKKH